MSARAEASSMPAQPRAGWSLETVWGIIFLVPYIVVFFLFVVWPVSYGVWLGSDPDSYKRLFADRIYMRTVWNTAIFLGLGVNLKLFLALLISGFLMQQRVWIRWLSVIFILPWAVPSIPTILSVRWMLNSEWGMLNGMLWDFFLIEGPYWLVDPQLAFGSAVGIHIWKYLPFWTLIMMAGRMAIPQDLYEAARLDGASGPQLFAHVTWPQVRNLYITSTLLSTIWTLGDFNSVFLLTGGGPNDLTHVLATLGIRYGFRLQELDMGIATVMTALPILVPLVFVLLRRLGGKVE